MLRYIPSYLKDMLDYALTQLDISSEFVTFLDTDWISNENDWRSVDTVRFLSDRKLLESSICS